MIRISTTILLLLLVLSHQNLFAGNKSEIQAESFVTIPANIDFGKQKLNTPKSINVTLKNTGDSTTIQILYIKKSKVFYLETEVSEIFLKKDSSVTVTVVYVPKDEYRSLPGQYDTDSLIMQTEGKIYNFPLKGQGIAPMIEVEDWTTGIVSVGQNFCKKAQTGTGIKVRNSGSDTLTLYGISKYNEAEPFVIIPPAFPVKILPGADYFFNDICFFPQAAGLWNYNIVVNSNGYGTDSIMVLKGEAKNTQPYITGADFGLKRRLTVTDTILYIRNASNAAVKIADVKLAGAAANFVIDFANISPKIGGGSVVDLAPESGSGGIKEISVPIKYIPQTEGLHEASIIIVPGQAGFPENSLKAALSGTAFEPAMQVDIFEWPVTPIDTAVFPTGNVKITNTSQYGNLFINEIRWAESSKNQTDFTLIGEFPTNVTITNEIPFEMRFQFSPTTTGEKVALLEVISNRGPGPNPNPVITDTIRLVGIGTFPTDVTEPGETSVKVYPSPAFSELIIEMEGSSKIETELANQNGEVVYTGNEFRIDVSKFASGTYFLKIKQGQQTTFKKILIQR